MNGKIVIIFFMALFCLSSIPYFSNTVSALSITYSFGFEGTAAGINITSGSPSDNIFTSKLKGSWITAYFSTSSAGVRSGTRSFIINYGSTIYGWFNASYSKSTYITNFSMYLLTGNNVQNFHFYFYNYTLGVGSPIIRIVVNSGSPLGVVYYNEVGSQVSIGNMYVVTYTKIGFDITDALGNVDYQVGSTVVGGVAKNPTAIIDGYRIDRIYIQVSGQTAMTAYIDDLNYTVSDSYVSGSGGSDCGIDLNDYSKIGIDNTPNGLNVAGYQLMKIYNVYTTGTLKAVSICVLPEQYEDDNNTNNYTCAILGYPEQSADCFYKDGFNYRLVWECNIDLGEEIPNQQNGYILYAQFFHRKLLDDFPYCYWLPCISSSSTTDLDNDGDVYFKYGNTDGVPQSTWLYDLGVSFYLTKESTLPDTDLPDSLGLHNWVSKNTTGYLYEIGQPEGIVCSYILGNSAYSYFLDVNLNGSLFKRYSNLDFPAGVIGFIPLENGRYDFKLYNYHYVYNVTAYVSGSLPSDFFLSTDPLFTQPYESYNIYYKYYHPQEYDGLIGIFENKEESSNFSEAHTTYGFPNNKSNTIPHDSVSLTNEYLTLFVDKSPFNPVYHTTHYINNPSVVGSWDLYLSRADLEISRGNPENLNVSIGGFHPFLASDIGIYIDGVKRYDVREQQVFAISFIPHDNFNKVYNISLVVRQNDGLTVLKTVFFTVHIKEDEGGGVTPTALLPAPFSYIAGAIVTLMFVIAPSVFIGKIGIENDMMKFVPVFSGMLGFILCCLVGFFPWYAIFGLVLILVLIITIMWQKNK